MPKTVLIIDDESDLVEAISARFEHEGFQTMTAANGVTGYRHALRHKPDIILLDIMMPAMDGFHTCRMLKRCPQTQKIPVIMLTALNERKDVLSAIAAGAQDYALKPVDFRSLVGKVVRQMQNGPTQDAMLLETPPPTERRKN